MNSSASNAFILVMKKLTKVASLKSKLFEQIKSHGVVSEPYQVLDPVKWRIYKVFEANLRRISSECCMETKSTQIIAK
jgi:hypothetical protein